MVEGGAVQGLQGRVGIIHRLGKDTVGFRLGESNLGRCGAEGKVSVSGMECMRCGNAPFLTVYAADAVCA